MSKKGKHGQVPKAEPVRTAYDYRDRLRTITGWSDYDLQQLPIVQDGRMKAGETYFNLNLPEIGPFMAQADEEFPTGYLFVAKGSVSDEVWLRLIDSWGTDLEMGNYAPQPGAFDGHSRQIKTGYGSSGREGAGEGTERAA